MSSYASKLLSRILIRSGETIYLSYRIYYISESHLI